VERGGESEGGEGEDGPGEMSLAKAGEVEDKDEAEGVGGHQGMEERGEDEAESGREVGAERVAMVEREGYGKEREWGGEAASGDVGVHEEQRGAGDGECPEGG